jgi:hypothetical protein
VLAEPGGHGAEEVGLTWSHQGSQESLGLSDANH